MTEINSMPIKVMYDEDSNPFVPFVSLEAIGEINGENINEILDAKLEADNIKAGNQIDIEVKDGDVIIHNSATGLTVIDNLDTENPGEGALDARQGKVLKDSIPEVVNNLNTIDSDKALSAHQGYILAGRSVPVGGAEGQVLKKSADNDYALEWGDAADPNAIIGDGSIKKIVELTYEEYLALKDLEYLDSETEYHINNWTESGASEPSSSLFIVDMDLDVTTMQITSTSHYARDIIQACQNGKVVQVYLRYATGVDTYDHVICALDLYGDTGTAICYPLLRLNLDGNRECSYVAKLVIRENTISLSLDRLLNEDDLEDFADEMNTALNDFVQTVGTYFEEEYDPRLTDAEENIGQMRIVNEGQNTRLDIAEGNIDSMVNTINSHADSIGNLTVRCNNISNTISGNIMTVYSSSSSKDNPKTFTFGSGLYLVLAQVNGNHMGRVDMVYGAGSSVAGYTTIKEPSSNVFFEYNTNSITISSNYTCMIRILRMP